MRFTLLLTIELSFAQRGPASKEERCTERSNLREPCLSALRRGRYESVLTRSFSLSSLLTSEWRYAAFPRHRELTRHGDTANNLRAVSFSQASHLSGGTVIRSKRSPIRHVDVDVRQPRGWRYRNRLYLAAFSLNFHRGRRDIRHILPFSTT